MSFGEVFRNSQRFEPEFEIAHSSELLLWQYLICKIIHLVQAPVFQYTFHALRTSLHGLDCVMNEITTKCFEKLLRIKRPLNHEVWARD